MLSLILGIFGSSGFGALLGGATGLAKIWLEQRNRRMELDHEQARWNHEALLRDKDIELAKQEAEAARTVAIIEGSAKVEESAYNALAAAYASDKVSDKAWEAAKSSKWAVGGLLLIEGLQRSVRPLLTYLLTLSALYLNYWVIQYADKQWLTMTADQRLALITQITSWVLFQSSAVLSYWFVNRPTSPALQK